MKAIKQLLRPERLRQVPERFSWVDQALVQQHFIDRCEARSAALYLFLITVSDAQGLSYYGTPTLARRLRLSDEQFGAARQQLIDLDLIAYRSPLFRCWPCQGQWRRGARHRVRRPSPAPPPAPTLAASP